MDPELIMIASKVVQSTYKIQVATKYKYFFTSEIFNITLYTYFYQNTNFLRYLKNDYYTITISMFS